MLVGAVAGVGQAIGELTGYGGRRPVVRSFHRGRGARMPLLAYLGSAAGGKVLKNIVIAGAVAIGT